MAIVKSDDVVNKVEERDGEARLIPRLMTLETLSESDKKAISSVEDPSEPVEIKARPATEGEINEMSSSAQEQEEEGDELTMAEARFLEDHVIEPELDIRQVGQGTNIKNSRLYFAMLIALLSESTGVPQSELKEKIEKEINKTRAEVVQEEGFQGKDE